MALSELPCAASSLTQPLFDGRPTGLDEVIRTPTSVHYRTGDPRLRLLCLCTSSAVQLPNSVVVAAIPGPGHARIGNGWFRVGQTRWSPRRWWSPPRLHHLVPPAAFGSLCTLATSREIPGVVLPHPSYDGLQPHRLVGAGPGLTPAGDDVLAAALVSAHAIGDDRLDRWRAATRVALAEHDTTAVSRAMLEHALEGYATFELADFVAGLCGGSHLEQSLQRLLAVGHSSGAALLHGVLHTFATTHELRGAA